MINFTEKELDDIKCAIYYYLKMLRKQSYEQSNFSALQEINKIIINYENIINEIENFTKE